MSVTLQSTRFGELEVPDDAVIHFPAGLIGLGGTRYALLSRGDESAFAWLHAVEDPGLAIPVTDPWRFFSDFELEVDDEEAKRIGIAGAVGTAVYVTVRTGEAPEDFCANLRAPILVHAGRGHQVINKAPAAPVRAPLFASQEEQTSRAA